MRALILAAALLAGCAHDTVGDQSPSELNGAWIAATRAPAAPTIVFADDGASGFAGCNRWFGQATHDGQGLSFGSIGTTRMACEPPIMTIERNFLSTLENTRSYRFMENGTLVLLDAEGAELGRFLRQP